MAKHRKPAAAAAPVPAKGKKPKARPENIGKDERLAAYGDKDPDGDLSHGVAPEDVGKAERRAAVDDGGERPERDLHDGEEPENVGKEARLAAMQAERERIAAGE